MKKRLSIVFFLLGLTFLLTACGTTEINMNDYVDVSFSGYEYVGYLSCEVDIKKMMLDNEDSFGFDRKELRKAPGEDVLEDLEESLFVYYDSYTELKNDDKLTFHWGTDEDTLAEIEKEYKVTFLYEDFDITVSDLEPLTERNVFEYMDVEFSGSDGEGYLSYFYFDDYYIKDQLIISKSEGLSNGDVVTFTIPDTLISEYRWQGYNLVPASMEVTVSDLAVPEIVDAFSGIEVEFSGYSPYISVYVDTWYADYDFYYEYDSSGYFANGDTFTITLSDYSVENALNYNNIIPEATSKTYTISGQPTLITSLDDLDDAEIADLYNSYEADLMDTISGDWTNPESLYSVTAIGHAVSVEDTSYYTPDTKVTTFYKVWVTPQDAESFSYYYYIQHEDMYSENGSLYSNYDSYPYGYAFWGSAYGDAFIRNDLCYIGFETVESLLDATVYEDQNNYWIVDYVLDESAVVAPEITTEEPEDSSTTDDTDSDITSGDNSNIDFLDDYDYASDAYNYYDGIYLLGNRYVFREGISGFAYGTLDENDNFTKIGVYSFNGDDERNLALASFCYRYTLGEYVDGYYLYEEYAYQYTDDGIRFGYIDENGEYQHIHFESFYQGGDDW